MFEVRPAKQADAEAAIDVVRRSITELCAADHKGDVDTLGKWLSNKTPRHFLDWLANEDNFCAVAEENRELLGVALVNRSGEIALLYLAPGAQRRGIGKALHQALEQKAMSWGVERLRLNSTVAARAFYESMGYLRSSDATPHFGVLSCYPYEKPLKSRSSSSDNST